MIIADTLIAIFEVSLLCTSLIMGFELFAPEHIQPARMGRIASLAENIFVTSLFGLLTLLATR
ncbi:hypothetical protein NKH37_33730 [Mesorhizobium sp. M1217]|uniref:hypothetical protein n=1 Tax=Mesorhizobium sp. M1217 TaxID=2957070 RepID=UPI00333BC6B9